LLLLGGVILGPRRLVGLARDAGKLVGQIRSLTQELTRQMNREIAVLDLAESRQRTPAGLNQPPPSEPARLPEAYQRFREDFPDEGGLEPTAPVPAPALAAPTTPVTPAPAATPAPEAPDSLPVGQ
jgi:Sec-independent protein translocase protein TatA